MMVAFDAGGRRRSEMARLRYEQLIRGAPVETKECSFLPSLAISLGRTKTSGADHDEVVYLTGRPVEALNASMVAAKVDSGSVFRKIDRWGNVSSRALEPAAANAVVKQRVELPGLQREEFSAHGLRSG